MQIAAAILPKAERRSRIDAVHDFFPDLARQLQLAAGRLSGGQRQMLAVARALMVEPKLLMLDEASAGLSPRLVEMVFAKLKEICRAGMTILLVEQNARAALAISDRAYVLVEGQNRHEGRAADLVERRDVAQLYLGGGGRPPAGSAPVNLQFLVDGLLIGGLIGLGAIGVTLTYSILRFANFAHGEFIAWGAYAALGACRRDRRGRRTATSRSGRSPSAGRCSLAGVAGDDPDRAARARARRDAVQAAAPARHRHHAGDGELWRRDGAPQPARIHLQRAAGLFQPRHPDRRSARLRHPRHARPAGDAGADRAPRRRSCTSS